MVSGRVSRVHWDCVRSRFRCRRTLADRLSLINLSPALQPCQDVLSSSFSLSEAVSDDRQVSHSIRIIHVFIIEIGRSVVAARDLLVHNCRWS